MDQRRRLLEYIYSREGAAETSRDYRDPVTGAPVRMTPGQWALAEYDRQHGAPDADARTRDVDSDRARAVDDGPGRVDDRRGESVGDFAERDRRERSRRGILHGVLIGAAAFVVGALVTVGASIALGGPGATQPGAAAPSASPPDEDALRPLAGPAIQEYFRTAPRVDDLPPAVTDGFVQGSFHVVAGNVTLQESSTIYAAKRADGTFCLVAVADTRRAAETCATAEGISQHGLTLTKDAVRDLDGRPITVTVTWQRDGNLTFAVAPSVG